MMQYPLTCDVEENKKIKKKWKKSLLRTFDAVQGLDAVRKFIQQFDVEDDMLMMCSKLDKKLYSLKHQKECNQITILDWLKK